MRLFLTGTDTEIGKTHVARLLVKAWNRHHPHQPLTPLKPLCCGEDTDLQELCAAMDGRLVPSDICHSHWPEPAAPLVAARLADRPLNQTNLLRWCRNQATQRDRILLEGVGGWLVPLAPDWSVADWARELGWPVLLVVGNRLGALNHTLLTVKAIHAAGLPLAGILLNDATPDPDPNRPDPIRASNLELLTHHFHLPVWGRITHGQKNLEPELIARLAPWLSQLPPP